MLKKNGIRPNSSTLKTGVPEILTNEKNFFIIKGRNKQKMGKNMKINHKILSLPPYISTTWKNIQSIYLDESHKLIVTLANSTKITIPNLGRPILDVIFEAHGKYMETEDSLQSPVIRPAPVTQTSLDQMSPFGFPLKIGGPEGLESIGSAMQHNPAQADAPDLPEDILNKIAGIAKVLGLENQDATPIAEPHCNCVHCQIARALSGDSKEESNEEEIITKEDLTFRDWDITQTEDSEKLYVVSNPLDPEEKYNVYLGNPLGCTCGQKNCEHIRSVLNS